MKKFLVIFLFAFIPHNLVLGQIELPKIFASNMVLPRNKSIPIEGTAAPMETLQISIGDQLHSETADKKGNWKVVLEPMDYGGPFTLSFKGKEELNLENILVGDLWLCAGQSNMQYTLNMLDYVEKDTSRIAYPNLRLCSIGIGSDYLPQEEVSMAVWARVELGDRPKL